MPNIFKYFIMLFIIFIGVVNSYDRAIFAAPLDDLNDSRKIPKICKPYAPLDEKRLESTLGILFKSDLFKARVKDFPDDVRFSIIDSFIKFVEIDNKCVVSFRVYINSPEIYHFYNAFGVSMDKKLYIQDIEGIFHPFTNNSP